MDVPVAGAGPSGKLKVFLGVLLAMVIIGSITTGALMHTLVRFRCIFFITQLLEQLSFTGFRPGLTQTKLLQKMAKDMKFRI